jgi:hypothetical protein
MWSSVRYKGHIVRVRRHLVETEEQAQARAWFVAKQLPPDMPEPEKESRSRAWLYESKFGVKYAEESTVSDKNIVQ